MNVYTDIGKHVWIEIKAGGKFFAPQAYRCVKCGKTDYRPWNAPGPDLSGCAEGDKIFDRSILRRQPESGRSNHTPQGALMEVVSKKATGPGILLYTKDVRPPIPCFHLCVQSGNEILPVRFHNTHPGFVIVGDDEDKLMTIRILEMAGFKLSPGQQIALKPIISERQMDDLALIARACTDKVHGIYWGLRRVDGMKVQYFFQSFEERGKA